jgi:signal peptidase I
MNREYFLTFLEIILLLLLVVLPVRFFLFEPFLVRGQSMEPNFHNLDYLIIDKLSYFFRQPQRGEVVVFKPPFDDYVYYIKRIIGLPGERIIIEESKITEINLGPDEYFVLGDNREVSYDSRKWGPIKKERIAGRVIFQFSLVKLAQALTR